MEMAAPRGRVLFFGGLPKGTTHIRFPSNILHYQEVQVHGSYASRHRDQVHALDMLAADVGGLRGVVSDVVDLDDAPGAFAESAPARCSRSSSRRRTPDRVTTLARRSLRHSLADGLRDRVVGGRVRARATGCPASPSSPAAWASRAAPCARRSRCSRRTGSSGGCTGSGTYVTDRPLLRNDLSRNFGVSSMIAAMGLEPGTVDEPCAPGAGAAARSRRRSASTPGDAGQRPAARAHRRRPAGGRHDRLVPRRRARARGDGRGSAGGSIYAALAERGLTVHHGVAHDHARHRRWARSRGGWTSPAAPCS